MAVPPSSRGKIGFLVVFVAVAALCFDAPTVGSMYKSFLAKVTLTNKDHAIAASKEDLQKTEVKDDSEGEEKLPETRPRAKARGPSANVDDEAGECPDLSVDSDSGSLLETKSNCGKGKACKSYTCRQPGELNGKTIDQICCCDLTKKANDFENGGCRCRETCSVGHEECDTSKNKC